MTDAASHLPAPWAIRAAVHLGPVVAGVVGRSKLAFDLWGDTVNVAARLAGHGLAPGVYCTAAARRSAAGRLEAEALGALPIRGKGAVEVWRCLAIRTGTGQGGERQ